MNASQDWHDTNDRARRIRDNVKKRKTAKREEKVKSEPDRGRRRRSQIVKKQFIRR